MKLPEPLFIIINPTIKTILRSPLHWVLSKDLMLITFAGKKSKKIFTTPVRYVSVNGVIRCFTSHENLWWRNMRGGADVVLRIKGQDKHYHATAIENDPARTKEALVHYLGLFPQDAAYHDIKLTKDKKLVEEDLNRASTNAIVVEARPI